MGQSKFYIPGLDPLRTIACLSVVVGHLELFKQQRGIQNLFYLPYFRYTSGHTGVTLFFVLSGFIITLLLLKEQKEFKKISLNHFYIRRLLRVWPLYFMVLLISLVVFGYRPGIITASLCFTVFPNIAHALNMSWSVNPVIWSIGVEEQFYLFHPLLVRTFKKHLFVSLFAFFIIYTLLPQFILCFLSRNYNHPKWEEYINNFFYFSKFNIMAIGAMCAILHHKYSPILKSLLKFKPLTLLLFFIPFYFWLSGFHQIWEVKRFCINIIDVTDEFYGILFGITILLIVNSDFLSLLLDKKPLNYFGKISYGIYMYHWFIMAVMIKLSMPVFAYNSFCGNIFFYTTSISLTILVASLSYKYFETFFLRFRNKFSKIST